MTRAGTPMSDTAEFLKKLTSVDSKPGRRFALFIQTLIVLSLVSFSWGTVPGLSPLTKSVLAWFELVAVAIFTAEYVLRVWAAEKKTVFIFSFYGLVDLAAILPFYLRFGIDLRSIRILRLLRLFRILKLLRYNQAMTRIRTAFVSIREELLIFMSATGMLLFLAAVGIYYCEHDRQPEAFSSIFACLWWAVTTLTTVGYGDTYPMTLAGKVFTFVILMLGLGVVAIPSGLMASALTNTKSLQEG